MQIDDYKKNNKSIPYVKQKTQAPSVRLISSSVKIKRRTVVDPFICFVLFRELAVDTSPFPVQSIFEPGETRIPQLPDNFWL